MNAETYERISKPIRSHPNGMKIINVLNKLTTSSVYLAHPISLIILFINGDKRFWNVLLVPAISFILLSFFRKAVNAPRPYELLDIDPIIKKNTKGNSFPSRHVFSVFVIAMSLYYVWPSIGIVLMLIGIIISVIRVIGGVHFPRDVIAGAIMGVGSSIIGWYVSSLL